MLVPVTVLFFRVAASVSNCNLTGVSVSILVSPFLRPALATVRLRVPALGNGRICAGDTSFRPLADCISGKPEGNDADSMPADEIEALSGGGEASEYVEDMLVGCLSDDEMVNIEEGMSVTERGGMSGVSETAGPKASLLWNQMITTWTPLSE